MLALQLFRVTISCSITVCLFRNTSYLMIWYPRIAPLLRSSRNPTNIRNPLIYCVNRYFLMFGGSQVQKPYHASMNGILTFCPWYHNKKLNRVWFHSFHRMSLSEKLFLNNFSRLFHCSIIKVRSECLSFGLTLFHIASAKFIISDNFMFVNTFFHFI